MARERAAAPASGKYACEGLDRLLHEKARLGILTSLLTHPTGLRFNELKDLCSLTDGNLSRHLQVLAEAGLVEIWKGYEKKRPQTLCRLSPRGRERFLAYLEELERVLKLAVEQTRDRAAHAKAADLPPGWVPA